MGRTYRNNNTRRYEDGGRKRKAWEPSEQKRRSGVKIIKQIYDDNFEDDVDVEDQITINKNSDDSSV